jgi:2'-5' RNA ligase
MSRTLLALLVPDAEPLVGDLRMRLDPAAKLGLAAHITLLYPFLDSDAIDDAVLGRLREVADAHAPLSFGLEEVGQFPSTVWLAPRPAEAIVALASALDAAFPERPATGRVFERFVPHVSVARNIRGDRDAVIATLEDRLRSAPGILCECAELHVMKRTDEGWRVHARVGLSRSM